MTADRLTAPRFEPTSSRTTSADRAVAARRMVRRMANCAQKAAASPLMHAGHEDDSVCSRRDKPRSPTTRPRLDATASTGASVVSSLPRMTGARGTEDRARVIAVRPNIEQPLLGQEHRAEVGLRVHVHDDHRGAEFRVHPREMVDQRGLADAAPAVEEGDRLHCFPGTVATTRVGSWSSNRASGLPFCRNASCARMTPRPKRLTYPSVAIASDTTGLR